MSRARISLSPGNNPASIRPVSRSLRRRARSRPRDDHDHCALCRTPCGADVGLSVGISAVVGDHVLSRWPARRGRRYRNDLLKLGGRITQQLHGAGDGALERLRVVELDQRAMRRGFASWASDHICRRPADAGDPERAINARRIAGVCRGDPRPGSHGTRC